jgi:two-component system, NtrC family, response regulator HydG
MVTVDVRVITATNLDLKKMVEEGSFREDLYFRLRVIDIPLPALSEREGDIPLLVHHFLASIRTSIGKEISGISDQAMQALCRYPWPGNVRELEHTLERAAVLCSGSTISLADLPDELHSHGDSCITPDPAALSTIDTAPKYLPMAQQIIETLRRTGGNKAKAARLLGCDRSTLYRRIKEARIDLSSLDL